MASASRDDNTVPGLIVTDATLGGDLVVSGDDYTNAQAVHVAIVDGSGNQVTSFGGSGGTSHGDDAAFTIGSASSITPMGALADETTPDSVDEGDVGVPRMTLDRILKVQGNDILTPDGDSVMDDTNDAVQVNVVAGSTSGTEYTEDDAAPANPDAPALSLVRDDVLSGQTSTDGDIVTARGTDKGEIYVKHADDVTIADGGNSITIDGTVTANLSATDNAVLDSIQTAVETIDNAISGTEMQVDIVSAPTLTVDLGANNDVTVTSGTITANLGATDNAVLDTIAADTTSLDGKDLMLGTDFSNVFGTAALTDGSNHLQVDIAADSVGIGGGTEATDDTTTHATGSTKGKTIMAAATPTDGSVDANDIGALAMSTDRRLHTDAQIVGQDADITIADGGNSITVDGTVTANLGATDNAVLDSIDTNTTTVAGAVSGTEMQVDVVASLPAGSNAIGKLAANSGVDIGDVDVLSLPSTVHSADYDSGAGTDTTLAFGIAVPASGGAAVIPGDATAGLKVDLGADNDVTVTGTVTVVGSTQTIQQNTNGALKIAGDRAHDATDAAGEPVKIGGRAHSSEPTAVAAADRVNAYFDTTGHQHVKVDALPASTNTIEVVGDVAHDAAASGNPNIVAGVAQDADDTAPPNRVSAEGDATRVATDFDGAVFTRPHGPQIWDYHLDTSTAQTDTTVHSAPGAGLSLYVTDIVFSSNDATAINLFFEESSTTVLGPYYLEAVAGRGMALHLSTPKKITANTALTLTTSASIAHSVDVTGYVAQG